MSRFINPVPQFLDSAGKPYIDGLVYAYRSGTTTDQDTFADVNLSIPNSNPIELGADGLLPNMFLKAATYNIIITGTDSVSGLLTQVWQRDPVGGESSEGQFSLWSSLTLYSTGEIVEFNGAYYRSISESNQGNSPDSSLSDWSEIKFTTVWNPNETYPLAAIVQGSDGLIYISTIADNTNNNPITDSVNWVPPINIDIELALTQATALSF
jgi:hypothetical protein